MRKNYSSKTPLQKWLAVNSSSPNLGEALRTLLGHAWVGIFRRALPKNPPFSAEKAILMAMQLPKEVLPEGFSDWVFEPHLYAEAIVSFCENSEFVNVSSFLLSSAVEKNSLNLRGVRCPLNAMRAKVVLQGLSPDEELEILLDDGAPIENVPQALVAEGHSVLLREKKGDYWLLRVRKRVNTK